MIYYDTREHEGKNNHILEAFKRAGVTYERHKLDTGDYKVPGGMVTIDRKKDLEEIAGNLCSKDGRFWREARRAHDTGLKLIVLVETDDWRINCIEDVKTWQSKHSRVTGANLAMQMFRLHMAYGTEFLFCKRENAGWMIMQLLGVSDGEEQRMD